MNLRWSGSLRRFEAEFSSDFHGDLAAVKAAGFKTDGAPEWIWYSYKAAPLEKLRGKRPASGLTITAEAREQYLPLAAMEASNAKVKAELAQHKKTLKKKLDKEEQEGRAFVIPEKGYIDASDLPPMPPWGGAHVVPAWDGARCSICQSQLLSFELHNPNICTWCEKIVLDNVTEVC